MSVTLKHPTSLLALLCRWIAVLSCAFSCAAWALERDAFTFILYDLELRMDPAAQALGARGRITLRNDSPTAQRAAVLQISSTLTWNSIESGGKPLAYVAQPYTTDIDHTGSVTQAVVTLPHEVAPRREVELEVAYSGAIPQDSTRLRRVGAPAPIAARNDWDRISESFTALRGVGYVAWYPVAVDAVSISDAAFGPAVGAFKARHALSEMRLRLVLPSGQMAVTNGRLTGEKTSGTGTLRSLELVFAPLGPNPPLIAVATYAVLARPAVEVYYLGANKSAAADYAFAVESALSFTTEWFGAAREKVRVVEIPVAGAAAFESGPMLVTPLTAAVSTELQVTLVHQLVHASLASPRPWINEGLAHFAQAAYRERQAGRRAALAFMDSRMPALALAERSATEAQGSAARSLLATTDEVFYRTKAMFVWWMLRDMLGDDALGRVIRAYRPDQDRDPAYVQKLAEAQAKHSLEWFFDDWVYRDRGLPDFRVESAYARATLGGASIVTVEVENLGSAGAEVPVTVRTEAGEISKRLVVAAKQKAAVRIEVPAAPLEAVVNDGSVPESDMSNNAAKVGR